MQEGDEVGLFGALQLEELRFVIRKQYVELLDSRCLLNAHSMCLEALALDAYGGYSLYTPQDGCFVDASSLHDSMDKNDI